MPETCITFGKIGARVTVEDKEIQHYAMHVDPVKKVVSCWIASEAGKNFQVVWLEHQVDLPTTGRLYLDGHRTIGIQRAKIGDHFDKGPAVFRDVCIADLLAVSYLFSPLVVTDDDASLDTSCSVGEIKLDTIHTTAPILAAEQHVYHMLPQPQKVHERFKKAIHQVTYGNHAHTIARSRWYKAKKIEKVVTFIFKYRPLEMLQANEIAPRDPHPLESQKDTLPTAIPSSGKRKHSEVKEDSDSDSEGEDEDEDSKREKALLAELERIRQARHSKGAKRPKKQAEKENKPLFIPGEVNDLT